MRPRIGIIPGDPSGIGPELVAKLAVSEETRARADILLIGDGHVLEMGARQAGTELALEPVDARRQGWDAVAGVAHHPTHTIAPEAVAIGQVTERSGRSAIANLDLALDLVGEGVLDAIVFAPFNKAALHRAGLGHEDELHYMAARLGVEGYISEINTADGMWTSRVTSHIALRHVADMVSRERIDEATRLIHRMLRRAGVGRPRIAVAGLNPHAGDGGNFGREEIEVIGPAVERLAAEQMAVDGPWPSDTVFLKLKAREVDAVVTMYHDQGQIALKLLGFDRGVTVQGGLPFPVTTPAHGTAFDIAGQGTADLGATWAAFGVACDMVDNRGG